MKMLTKPKQACCAASPRDSAAPRSGAGEGESAAQCCAKSSRLVTGCHD
jgi:hypothetical protein